MRRIERPGMAVRLESTRGGLALLCALAMCRLAAQQAPTPKPSALRTVHIVQDRLTFQIPPDWALATRDRELSTFHLEARGASASARLRSVAAMPENPFPESTFSGAHFYVSSTPRRSREQCAHQAGRLTSPPGEGVLIGGQPATRVHDEHGAMCTQFRDDIYTVYHRGACLRFDLAMNNFCGGEVSGVRDMTPGQIEQVYRQLENILNSVSFDP